MVDYSLVQPRLTSHLHCLYYNLYSLACSDVVSLANTWSIHPKVKTQHRNKIIMHPKILFSECINQIRQIKLSSEIGRPEFLYSYSTYISSLDLSCAKHWGRCSRKAIISQHFVMSTSFLMKYVLQKKMENPHFLLVYYDLWRVSL